MTIQRHFYNWATSGLDYRVPPYENLSPNIRALGNYLCGAYGGQVLGWDDNNRDIREGGAISAHAYGAPIDWRYEPNWLPNTTATTVSRETVTGVLIPWLVDYSAELMIDAIHDYLGDRIWRAGRTTNTAHAHTTWWRDQNGAGAGMGESWARYLHIESTHTGFLNATPIEQRGIALPGGVTPPPIGGGFVCLLPQPTLRAGSIGDPVRVLQDHIRFYGFNPGPSDGLFGPRTETALKGWQRVVGTTADGVYGPRSREAGCRDWEHNPARIANGW